MSRIQKNKRMLLMLFIAIASLLLWSVQVVGEGNDDHDHDHDITDTVTENHDNCDGHDHDAEEEGSHDDHNSESTEAITDNHTDCDGSDHGAEDDELVIELSQEAMKLASILTSKAAHGRINESVELPGEVGFNEEKLVHIAPRFAGIALKTNFRVGDYVTAGEVVALIESNESMSAYSIKAPISGWVIERHITPGEFVSEENSIYVIADLSTVWVNLAVYPKDVNRIKKGQTAEINAIGSSISGKGTIDYISPIMDLHTRSLTARVVLSNPNQNWRPGAFVHALISMDGGDEGLVVQKDAVQYLDGISVLFVVDGTNRFRPAEIVTGSRNGHYIQVLEGIEEGVEYVSNGAFELKAKIVTSNMDAHAGHGH